MTKGFVASIGSVLTGTLIAQLIPIMGTIILARIFAPAAFGVFAAWLGGVLFFGVVLTCRFETSLAVEEDGRPRRQAVVMTLLTIVLMSILAFSILTLAMLTGLIKLSWLPQPLLILSLPTAAFVAATQTLQTWAAADGRYKHLSIMRIVQAASVMALQIVCGLVWPSAEGLGYGYLVGTFIGLAFGIAVKPCEKFSYTNMYKSLSMFWRNHRRFPIFSLPADAVNSAAAQLPVLIVTTRFGPETAGMLAMALRMLGAPMSLLGASVLDVFKRQASQAYRERGECRAEYIYTLRILSVIAVFAAIIIGFGSEYIFVKVFGAAWLGAGTISLWFLPRFAVGFVASPLSYMVYISDKQHIDLVWQLALLAMSLTTLLLVDTPKASMLSYSFGYGGLYLIYLVMSYRFSMGKANDRDY